MKATKPEISALIGSTDQCLFLCGSHAEARHVAKVSTDIAGGTYWLGVDTTSIAVTTAATSDISKIN